MASPQREDHVYRSSRPSHLLESLGSVNLLYLHLGRIFGGDNKLSRIFIEKKKLTLLVEVLSKDETSIRLPSIGSGEDREMVLTFKMEKNHVLWSCRSNRLSTKKHAQSSIRCKEQDEMV